MLEFARQALGRGFGVSAGRNDGVVHRGEQGAGAKSYLPSDARRGARIGRGTSRLALLRMSLRAWSRHRPGVDGCWDCYAHQLLVKAPYTDYVAWVHSLQLPRTGRGRMVACNS